MGASESKQNDTSRQREEDEEQQQGQGFGNNALKVGAAVAGVAAVGVALFAAFGAENKQNDTIRRPEIGGSSSSNNNIRSWMERDEEEEHRFGSPTSNNNRGSMERDKEEGHGFGSPTNNYNHKGGTRATLKILTYNLWSENLKTKERMKAIGGLIENHSPDLICFQEVTPEIYALFERSNWWKEYFISSQSAAVTKKDKSYFIIQLSKVPVKSSKSEPLKHCNPRELCQTEIKVDTFKSLVVATIHLKSPRNEEQPKDDRKVQANQALKTLKNLPNVIFGGDMNWDEDSDGQFPLPNGWVDAWEKLRPGENGYTYDTESNKMISKNSKLPKRFDRFVCYLRDFSICAIEMIGTKEIRGVYVNWEEKIPAFPSDHYGLLLTICPK